MKRHIRLLVFLFVLAFLFYPRAFAVIGGSTKLSSYFPEVVRMQTRRTLCTATIIGPRVVLSAAHCASGRGASFIYGKEKYRVKYVASRFYSSKNHDISVGLVDRDIRGAKFASVPGLLNSPLVLGDEIHIAGYGCTKRGGGGGYGRLRIGTSMLVAMDEENIIAASQKGGAVCFGDSGGPSFVRKNGKRFLVGVNSRGNIRNASVGVRVDSGLSQQFFKKVEARFKVSICGVSAICADGADIRTL